MIKKFFVTLIASSAFLVSCNNDDDNGVDKETKIPVEERKALDDKAINEILEDYYFSPKNGKLTKFDTIKGNEDDAYPALKKLAKQDPSGYWYAENPNHIGKGSTVVSNDKTKIHLNYVSTTFRGTNDMDKTNNPLQKHYGALSLGNNGSSIDTGDGSALTDPSFYYFIPSEIEAKNGVTRKNVELTNFVEALKHFKSTDRSTQDGYNFQGVIILPSQLAYGRDKFYTGNALSEYSQYRDVSFIYNIELVKTEERTTTTK